MSRSRPRAGQAKQRFLRDYDVCDPRVAALEERRSPMLARKARVTSCPFRCIEVARGSIVVGEDGDRCWVEHGRGTERAEFGNAFPGSSAHRSPEIELCSDDLTGLRNVPTAMRGDDLPAKVAEVGRVPPALPANATRLRVRGQ